MKKEKRTTADRQFLNPLPIHGAGHNPQYKKEKN